MSDDSLKAQVVLQVLANELEKRAVILRNFVKDLEAVDGQIAARKTELDGLRSNINAMGVRRNELAAELKELQQALNDTRRAQAKEAAVAS